MGELARQLRHAASAESRRRRIAWASIALFLVGGPVGFTLARESEFPASVELFPGPVKPYASELDPAYYTSLLADPELQKQMRLNARAGVAEYRRAVIGTPEGRVPLRITVRADRPARARELVNALAPQIVGASRRELRTRATRDAGVLRSRLRSRRLDRTARRAARRQIRRLDRLLASTRDPAVLGQLAPTPRLRSWADRLADALPGGFRTRPSPMGAGLAGLFMAVTLWVIGLVVVPPGREWGGFRRTRASSGATSADAVVQLRTSDSGADADSAD
jgi:hypothetical protein